MISTSSWTSECKREGQCLLVRVALDELWLGNLRCVRALGSGVRNPLMGALLQSPCTIQVLSDLCWLGLVTGAPGAGLSREVG